MAYAVMLKKIFDFNKEIFFGEIGALISIPIITYLVSLFTKNATLISAAAVIGSITGASLFWLLMRAYDDKRRHELSFNRLATDIGYFTPAAFATTLLVYYPVLFLLSRYMIIKDSVIFSSVIIAQLTAFSLFLLIMNFYHHYLYKITGTDL